ncbi:hypothetical protein N7509_011471 [Penicillium cosmopolitanum]|uniref:HAT C-terminal dimerisation domain-containing protein n=1 Tax=Penicillium cosmopolitanum TaxID=1131564 RepID=A0A9W9VTL3_9EURO|nr:uncharacterized protein N7509_011471 [Penicillium cosmopolitanum]KAJ5388930.1 hypothetical protein N7509_011471 [Penicillium cosmopolitanum]
MSTATYKNRQLNVQTDDLYKNSSDHESFDNIEYLVESSVVGDLQQNDQDEVSRYLNAGIQKAKSILTYWKDYQQEYPLLACLAKDFLAAPATGTGVKCLFNSARNICHYRRSSLNPTTIQDLIMLNCTSDFENKTADLMIQEAYLLQQDIEAEREERRVSGEKDKLEPISDNEEEDTA